jgi:hypothetical protein
MPRIAVEELHFARQPRRPLPQQFDGGDDELFGDRVAAASCVTE